MKRSYLFLFIWFLLGQGCSKKIGGDYIDVDPPGGLDSASTLSYRQKSKQVFDKIQELYAIQGTQLLKENYPQGENDRESAYYWSHSTAFTGAVLLKSLGENDPGIESVIHGVEHYWDASRTPVGFESFPGIYGGGDRFYDDNAIAGIDDVLAYKVTNDQQYLARAELALAFVMSGESADQGGGLFWCEQNRLNDPQNPNTVKATNSSALGVNLALSLYQITENQTYLTFAQRVYQWIKETVQDPSDHLYWNDVHAVTGVINTRKWTYNSGAMISNAILFYQITGEEQYLFDAKQDASSAYTYFTREVPGLGRFFPDHDPWFTAVLLRGFLDLYEEDGDPTYINTLVANVDYAWDAARNSNGLFMEDWSGNNRGRETWIINQNCMVEIYALIAKFKRES